MGGSPVFAPGISSSRQIRVTRLASSTVASAAFQGMRDEGDGGDA